MGSEERREGRGMGRIGVGEERKEKYGVGNGYCDGLEMFIGKVRTPGLSGGKEDAKVCGSCEEGNLESRKK